MKKITVVEYRPYLWYTLHRVRDGMSIHMHLILEELLLQKAIDFLYNRGLFGTKLHAIIHFANGWLCCYTTGEIIDFIRRWDE